LITCAASPADTYIRADSGYPKNSKETPEENQTELALGNSPSHLDKTPKKRNNPDEYPHPANRPVQDPAKKSPALQDKKGGGPRPNTSGQRVPQGGKPTAPQGVLDENKTKNSPPHIAEALEVKVLKRKRRRNKGN
jgi:hypothetical protein